MSEAPSAAAAAAVPAPAKKGKGMLIIIVVAIVVAGAVGGGVYFFSKGKSDTEAQAKDEKGHAKGAKGEEHKPKAPAVYVKMDPPFVVNFEAKGLMRFLQVSVEVVTRDPPTADMLKLHDPRIRNDLLLLLGNQQFETISSREGKESLRAEALKTVANVIASEGGDAKQVEQLFFTSFVMQ